MLICENVPDLVGTTFVKDYLLWINALQKLGFTSYHEILNARDYNIPQNRKRVFVVSLPGQHSYTFPRKISLQYHLRDILEEHTDKKYYLSKKMLNGMMTTKFHQYQLENRLQDLDSICDTLTTATGDRCPHLVSVDDKIRRLTTRECMRLMGFEDSDWYSLHEGKMTDSQIYKVAGDSIVVSVLMGIFGTLLDIKDYEQKILDYTKSLTEKNKKGEHYG